MKSKKQKTLASDPSPAPREPAASPEWEPAQDAAEQVRRWDTRKSIWTIEMGGMGPGYEQAIQVLAVEITRDNLGKPLPDPNSEASKEWGFATVERIDQKQADGSYSCGGFSGAQVGAARWLAYQWLSIGPAALHADKLYDGRHIQALNYWPRVPETPSSPSKSEERS
jgi:hypothetical protein